MRKRALCQTAKPKYICVLLSRAEINVTPLYSPPRTKSRHVFHLSFLDASYTARALTGRGNFLFRAVPASRSNLSSKPTRARAASGNKFPQWRNREKWSPRVSSPMSMYPFPYIITKLRAARGRRKRKTHPDRVTTRSFLAAPSD